MAQARTRLGITYIICLDMKEQQVIGYNVCRLGLAAEKRVVPLACLLLHWDMTTRDGGTMAHEEWRDVVGFEGYYQVSNLGRVISNKRLVKRGDRAYRCQGMVLTQSERTSGSLGVYLRKGSERKNCSVDRLVAAAFLPEQPENSKLIHLNGVISDNRAENLEWVTKTKANKVKSRDETKILSMLDVMPKNCANDEEWCDIDGFEDSYQVSNYGRVRSKSRFITKVRKGTEIRHLLKGRIIKQQMDKYGYFYVHIGGKNRKVHRLVMEAFIGKSDLTVNHKDEDKSNNHISNLEYMTIEENLAYGTGMDRRRVAARRRGRPIEQIDITTGNVIRRYEALVDVEADGFSSQNVGKVCMGKISCSGGYNWRYADVRVP